MREMRMPCPSSIRSKPRRWISSSIFSPSVWRPEFQQVENAIMEKRRGKLQIPNPKFQRNPKPQAPKSGLANDSLGAGIWSFFGIWDLELGILERRYSKQLSYSPSESTMEQQPVPIPARPLRVKRLRTRTLFVRHDSIRERRRFQKRPQRY